MNRTHVIRATEISGGDVYWFAGHQYQANDVGYDDQLQRATWTAVWTGFGPDPGAGWHSYESAGNELRSITLADVDDLEEVWCDICFGPADLCLHDRQRAG
jgi:hypothetical protein